MSSPFLGPAARGQVSIASRAIRLARVEAASSVDPHDRLNTTGEAREAAALARAANLGGAPPPRGPGRPTLTAANVVEYMDWCLKNVMSMRPGELEANLRACELVIRIHMAEAQAKDNQHTLVRDGVIDAPPAS